MPDKTKVAEIAVLSFLAILLSVYWWPLFTLGSSNLNVVGTFNTDEANFLFHLNQAFQNKVFDIQQYWYGHLYYNAGLLILFILDYFTEIDEQRMVIVFRMLSFLFYLGSVFLVFKICKQFFGKVTAWLSSLILLTGPVCLIKYAVMLHPDTAQLFFILLSVYGLAYYTKDWQYKWVLLAAMGAGLAFSTKYAGVALLAMILPLVILSPKQINFNPYLSTVSLVILLLVVSLLFNPDYVSKFIWKEEPEKYEILSYIAWIRILSYVLLIFTIILLMFSRFKRGADRAGLILSKLLLLIIPCFVFLIAFVITSPGAAVNFNFLNGIIYVSNAATLGHYLHEVPGFYGWLRASYSPDAFNIAVVVLSGMGMLVSVIVAIRQTGISNRLFRPANILLLWILLYVGILTFRVQSMFLHYLIPLFPFLAIFASYIVAKTLSGMNKYQLFKKRKNMVFGIAGLMALIFFLSSFHNTMEYKNRRIMAYQTSDALEAGRWMEENIFIKSRVLYDIYSYIPPIDHIQADYSWNMSDMVANEFKADYLILNEKMYSRFADTTVPSYKRDKEGFLKTHNFYASLLENKSLHFHLLRDFKTVKIYQRRPESYLNIMKTEFSEWLEVIHEKLKQIKPESTVAILEGDHLRFWEVVLKKQGIPDSAIFFQPDVTTLLKMTENDSVGAVLHINTGANITPVRKRLLEIYFPEMIWREKRKESEVIMYGRNPLSYPEPLFKSKNDFEREYACWNNDTSTFHTAGYYSAHAEKIGPEKEYGTVFSIPYGDLSSSETLLLVISAKAYFYNEYGEANLVISFERDNESIDWQSTKWSGKNLEIKQWNDIALLTSAPLHVKPGDMVKVYVWNRGDGEILIDDMEIKAYLMKEQDF